MLLEQIQKKLTLPKEALDRLESELPYLRDHLAERLFTVGLIKGVFWVDKRTGYRAAPYGLLAAYMGATDKDKVKTKKLLDSIEIILPGFRYRNYYHQEHESRMIIDDGLEPWMRELLYVQPGPGRVDVATKKVITISKEQKEVRTWQKVAEDILWNNPDQKLIAHHLNTQDIRHYRQLKEDHFIEAWHAAKERSERDGGSQLCLLHQVYELTRGFYEPIGIGSRVFGLPFQNMAKDIRKIYFNGCYEIDLQNCQLAIIAGILKIPNLQNIVKSGTPIWKILLNHLGIPENRWDVAKPEVKIAAYSITYGMKPHSAEFILGKGLAEVGLQKELKLAEHLLIKELIEALERAKNKIRQYGGMMTAYGWKNWDGEEHMPINTFFAHAIQSFETAIVAEIYKVAERDRANHNELFYILVHQHDGVLIKLAPGATIEKVIERVQYAVMNRAKQFGVYTFVTA